MSNIKLVLSDIDGTLSVHMQNEASDAVRQAVIDVENSGVKIAVVTGRAYPQAKNLLNILGVEGLGIFDGGATIVDVVSGDICWKQWLNVQATQSVIAILKKFCSESYFNPRYEMIQLSEVNVDLISEEAPCIFAIAESMDLINQAAQVLESISGIYTYVGMGTHPDTNENWPSIQIALTSANKFHGVEALRDIVGVAKDDTLAIGDGNNDISLFENASTKIAMGNATESLKIQADHIVGTLEEDGFAEAMQKYVLQ